MRQSEAYTGHIIFEGGSSLLGVGDEQGRGGYRGRLEDHYTSYTLAATRREPMPTCPWVTVHGTGVIDRNVERYAPLFSQKVDTALAEGSLSGYRSHLVAVLLFGSSLADSRKKYGDEGALDMYRDALDMVQAVCEQRDMPTIGLAVPLPDGRLTLKDGTKPDPKMRQTTIDMTAQHMPNWAVPTEIFAMQEIAWDPADKATDGAHLSASGYEKVATLLVPCIDRMLGIDTTQFL